MSILKRELGAENLQANFAYLNSSEIVNDYDSCYPWSDMKIVEDSNGNKWLQIPKFYTKYELDEDGYISARYISRYNVNEDWHLNPIFLNSSGKELSSVEIACYQIGVDSLTNTPVSKAGYSVDRGRTIAAMRSLVDNYDLDERYDYSLYNIWAHILVQDLFMIEYANSNIGNVLPGYCYTEYNKKMLQTGESDKIDYHTCIIANKETNTPKKYGMKYRYLENIVGNGITILDGIVCSGETIKITINNSEKDTEIKRPLISGKVAKLSFDKETKLVFPTAVGDDGTYGDVYRGDSTANQIMIVGRQDDEGYGLFSYGFIGANSSHQYGTYRMIRKQK